MMEGGRHPWLARGGFLVSAVLPGWLQVTITANGEIEQGGLAALQAALPAGSREQQEQQQQQEEDAGLWQVRCVTF